MSQPTENEMAHIIRMECQRTTIASIQKQILYIQPGNTIRCYNQEICEKCEHFNVIPELTDNVTNYITCTLGRCNTMPNQCKNNNVSKIFDKNHKELWNNIKNMEWNLGGE